MKHSLSLFAIQLLASCAALHAADALQAATNRPLVGVIRWDGYTGSPHVTQQQEMGFLKSEKWQSRAPWFFRKTGDPEHPLVFNPNYDKRTIREITDQEIEYAASAGIDYWAFCSYPKYKGGWQLRDSFDAYLASPLKNKIKASLILIGEHVGKGLSPAASAAPDTGRKDWEKLVNEIVPLLRDGSFQTAYVLALEGRIFAEPDEARTAAERLAQKIAGNEFRMATGFLGAKPLLLALTANGQTDLAVRLFQSRNFPSWGYEVVRRAQRVCGSAGTASLRSTVSRARTARTTQR